MKTWNIWFFYNGNKYLLFQIKATIIDLEGEFPEAVCVGSVDEKGDFTPDELLISKIITFYASVDRKGVQHAEHRFSNIKNQSIYGKICIG